MDKRMAIAVDLGATNLRVGLVYPDGRIAVRLQDTTQKQGRDGNTVTEQVSSLIKRVLAKAGKGTRVLSGVGISSIGPLDYDRGGPRNSPNIPYSFIPLVKPLGALFHCPVVLLNDCNAAVVGERRFGIGRGLKNLVYLTISTGIGGGVIADGKLLLGKSGNAGEIGHLTVDTSYNLPCSCGHGIGHWEGYVSGRNIPRFFRAWMKKKAVAVPYRIDEARDVFARARTGDLSARKFLDELNKLNARAISNIVVAYDPELITLGGSVVLNNRRVILGGIKKYADDYLPLPPMSVTRLGENITLLGAAAAVFER